MFSSVISASQSLDLKNHLIIAVQENALDLARSRLAIKVKVFPKAFWGSAGKKDSRFVKPDPFLSYTQGAKANYELFEKCLGHKVSRLGLKREQWSN